MFDSSEDIGDRRLLLDCLMAHATSELRCMSSPDMVEFNTSDARSDIGRKLFGSTWYVWFSK